MVPIKYHYYEVRAVWNNKIQHTVLFQGNPAPVTAIHNREERIVGYRGKSPYGEVAEIRSTRAKVEFQRTDCGTASPPRYRIGQKLRLVQSLDQKVREVVRITLGVRGWRYRIRVAGSSGRSARQRWISEQVLSDPREVALLDK